MKKFVITTPYGDTYHVDSDGNIYRPSENPNISGEWKLKGIVRTNGSGYLAVPFARISEWLGRKPELLYKNGNPRYTVCDLDHGTTRVWGNTKVHGIKNIYEEV